MSARRLLPVLGPPARGSRVSSRVLVAVLALALGGIVLALLQAVVAQREARDQVELTSEVLSTLRLSLRAGLDAETGQRGFLLTEDPIYLEPHARAEAEWERHLERLDEVLGPVATPEQSETVARMKEIARAKLAELRETIDLTIAGRRSEAIEIVRSDLGKELMESFRAEVARLEETEERLLRAALARSDRVAARTLPILGILVGVVLALVTLGFWLERRTAGAEAAAREADALRAARERSDLLARELNHRVKNLFAVILSIVSISGRGAPDAKTAVERARRRIHALSLAHAVSQGQLEQKVVGLRDLLTATLSPYGAGERVALEGPDVELAVKTITPLGLVMHELATNAAKYGALGVAEGRVEVRWRLEDAGRTLALEWRERGGPPPGPDEGGEADGFGSLMIRQATQQLRGTFERDLGADGLRADLSFPLDTTT